MTMLHWVKNPSRTLRSRQSANFFLSRLYQLPPVVVFGVLFGCSKTPKVPVVTEFKVEVHAESDDGNALKDVQVNASHHLLGRTNNAGQLSFPLFGIEGQSVSIDWVCPEGTVTLEQTRSIRLAHTKSVALGAKQPLKIDAICPRRSREVVVVVHADQGGSIPVLIDGKIATVTSSDGFAEVLLNVDRSIQSIAVGLDTSSRPNLKPKSPNRRYDISTSDSILIFDQKFNVLPPVRAIARKEARHIPYRID